jgi:hypothetical protein
MDGRRFQGPPGVGQALSSGCVADLSEDGEIFDSDDDGLPLPRRELDYGGTSRHRQPITKEKAQRRTLGEQWMSSR